MIKKKKNNNNNNNKQTNKNRQLSNFISDPDRRSGTLVVIEPT